MGKNIPAPQEKCYELTLTPDYVSDWTFNDAIRELIQNGTDQEALDKGNVFSLGGVMIVAPLRHPYTSLCSPLP